MRVELRARLALKDYAAKSVHFMRSTASVVATDLSASAASGKERRVMLAKCANEGRKLNEKGGGRSRAYMAS